MISTIIFGGLGNQLFIYATARALALKLDTELAINIKKGFKDDILYHRHFELEPFNLPFVQSNLNTFDYPLGKYARYISRKVGRNILNPSHIFIKESIRDVSVDERIIHPVGKNIFLEGYWQSPKYFDDYAHIIRKDLEFKFPMPELVLAEEKDIFSNDNKTPICVGVRRYQECTSSVLNGIVLTGSEFYLRAMEMISHGVRNPVFYIFSQDIEWVKGHIQGKNDFDVRITRIKGKSAIDDLYLMSKFKYHIVSNSSFYWWGAYLANGIRVICSSDFVNKDCKCDTWINI